MYHGRKFHLNGKFKSMPEFEEAENFPRDCDDLKEFKINNLTSVVYNYVSPVCTYIR